MNPQETQIRIHRCDGTFIPAKAIPFPCMIPKSVYSSPTSAVLRMLFTWYNTKGELVAECWAQDFQAVEIVA